MKKRTIVMLVFLSFFIMLIASVLPDIEEVVKDSNQGGNFDWDKEAAKKRKQFENS